MNYSKDGVTIIESSPSAKVKSVTWNGCGIQNFDTHIVKDMTSFFRIARASNILYDDSDGFFLFNVEGQKYMFINELKSTFDTREIYHARNQIVSTFIKMNMLLNLFQGYNPDDFIIKGFIFSLPIKKDYLVSLHKQMFTRRKGLVNAEANFTVNLCYGKTQSLDLHPRDCFELSKIPLSDRGIFKTIEMHHVDIDPNIGSITLDIGNFI